jgi:hypothetical protein
MLAFEDYVTHPSHCCSFVEILIFAGGDTVGLADHLGTFVTKLLRDAIKEGAWCG